MSWNAGYMKAGTGPIYGWVTSKPVQAGSSRSLKTANTFSMSSVKRVSRSARSAGEPGEVLVVAPDEVDRGRESRPEASQPLGPAPGCAQEPAEISLRRVGLEVAPTRFVHAGRVRVGAQVADLDDEIEPLTQLD